MSRKFLPVLFYSLFVSIVFPGISHALNETIESGNMKDMFRAPFKLAGSGDMWTKGRKVSYAESCSEEGDFGFITKQINITDAFAETIYVAMETSFSMNNAYNISLGIYLYNGMAQPPVTNKPAFRNFFLQHFSLIYTVENSTASARNGVKWTHIFKFHKNDWNNIILVVKGVGVCARVYRMKVYYYYCGEKYFKGVRFPKTVSPFEGWKKVEANCSLNSSPSDQRRTLSGFCGYHGTWNIRMGMGCFCKKGFEHNTWMKCTPCPSRQFKPKSSNESCQTCPDKSNNTMDRTSCKCMEGYYHSTLKAVPTTAPCFGPITEKLNMRINRLPNKTVKVTWNAVKVDEEIRYSLHYDVQCFMCDYPGRKCHMACENAHYQPRQYNVTETFVDVSNLHPGHRYKFRVYPKTVINRFIGRSDWSYTETEPFQLQVAATKKPRSTSSQTTYFDYVAISGIAGGVLFMIMVVLLIVVVKRTRRFRPCQRVNGEDISLHYVDPTTYTDPERALSEFAKELDRNLIKFETIVGGGEFGDVYKGEMKLPDQPVMKVAIKTLKPGASHKNRIDFLTEASVMGQFRNLNVITLEGVVTKSTPLLIVTEFMENGSLDKYLKENDGMLNPLQLLGLARGVASGMEYLAGMHFVHRDLAARNVLVNDNLSCKVTDFGLSRDLDNTEDSEYESQGGKIAVRWTAPEAITDLKFSTASDIWSYGILLWEIMSFAEKPYRNWRNGEVVIWVNQGYRLPPPMICPKTVHELMKECWMTDRTKRPPFKEIVRIIDEWIKYPEKLNEDYMKVRRIEPLDNSTFTSLKDWLEAIEMGMYASNFSKAGYEELSDVVQLTEDKLLNKVGVTLVGHRHKIYERIKEMSEDMKLKREQPQ